MAMIILSMMINQSCILGLVSYLIPCPPNTPCNIEHYAIKSLRRALIGVQMSIPQSRHALNNEKVFRLTIQRLVLEMNLYDVLSCLYEWIFPKEKGKHKSPPESIHSFTEIIPVGKKVLVWGTLARENAQVGIFQKPYPTCTTHAHIPFILKPRERREWVIRKGNAGKVENSEPTCMALEQLAGFSVKVRLSTYFSTHTQCWLFSHLTFFPMTSPLVWWYNGLLLWMMYLVKWPVHTLGTTTDRLGRNGGLETEFKNSSGQW
jgi:hypothetical protein